MKLVLNKPDTLGAFASTLCMLHCLATPFIFIAHTCSLGGCASAPAWWRSLDYLFLIISFFAVYRSTKVTTKKIMKPMLWISWIALFITVMNEKINWLPLSENVMYVVAFTLVALHLFNLSFCQCKIDKCSTCHG